jgi:hypothetical protein
MSSTSPEMLLVKNTNNGGHNGGRIAQQLAD